MADEDTQLADTAPPRARRRRLGRTARRFAQNRFAMGGLIFLALLVLVAIFAPLVAPQDPIAQSLGSRFASPSSEHLLGADGFGRDQLSRLIFGARTSLLAGLQSVGLAVVVGMPVGMVAAYLGGWADGILNRVSDALMSIPALLLAIAIVAVLGPGLTTAMIAIGIVFTPRFFRIARGSTAEVRAESYIESCRALGCSGLRILWRHVLPNMVSPIIVQASLSLGLAIIAEASLSFLGLGVRPPTPSWGGMIQTASGAMFEAPFLLFAPGIMIVITVLAFSLVGDGWRDALGVGRENGAEGGE